jgi:hypothetical protein
LIAPFPPSRTPDPSALPGAPWPVWRMAAFLAGYAAAVWLLWSAAWGAGK